MRLRGVLYVVVMVVGGGARLQAGTQEHEYIVFYLMIDTVEQNLTEEFSLSIVYFNTSLTILSVEISTIY